MSNKGCRLILSGDGKRAEGMQWTDDCKDRGHPELIDRKLTDAELGILGNVTQSHLKSFGISV